MRLLDTFTLGLLAFSTPVLAHPQLVPEISTHRREAAPQPEEIFAPVSDLYKRKGGGGGGGKGGGGGSSGGSSGKGGSSGGSSGSSGSGSSGRGSAGSNAGGATRTGSGVTPRFGGKYGGGASTPYTAGGRSPRGGLAPVFLGVGLLSIYPGLWLYGAYGYGYHNPYNFRNRTARRNSTDTKTTNNVPRDLPELVIRQDDGTGVNESKPVTCLCAQYSVCGCDEDGDYTFLDSIIGDGDYFKLNQSLVTVADVNGTSTILLNGTLPNGTTAAGGDEDAINSTSAAMRTLVEASGYWVMIAAVGLTCFVI